MWLSRNNLCLVGILSLALFQHVSISEAKRMRENKNRESRREGKVFSLFSIVSFNNDPCQSTSTSTGGNSPFRNGTCFTSTECASKGGRSQGSCASGFGVCCVFLVTDAATSVSQNCTYIQNPGYPSPLTTTTSLSYTVNKCSPSVCSLRLDFEQFTILGPSVTTEINGGTCTDTFIVTTPTGQQIPTICGQNTGQHIYVDVGATASDSATLAFVFSGSSTNRQWEIKVTQVPCASASAPPSGCLQYLTGLTGRLTTFNFLDATGSSHLANQQYTTCIRQEQGFCCVRYQVCADSNSFSIDNTIATANGAALVDTSCTLDFVGISGASSVCQTNTGGVTTTERFCGNFFNPFTSAISMTNAAVCDCSSPFEVTFRTDNLADTQSAAQINRGVCLEYMQLPCT